MNYYFNFTVLLYNTPVLYKVSQINKNEYYAEPKDTNLMSFKFMKNCGKWFSENVTTRAQAQQIGKQIDHLLSPSVDESIVLS